VNKYIQLLNEAKVALDKDDLVEAVALAREFSKRQSDRFFWKSEGYEDWHVLLNYKDFCPRILTEAFASDLNCALELGNKRAEIPWEERYVE